MAWKDWTVALLIVAALLPAVAGGQVAPPGDDAGSGRDAPERPSPEVLLEPDTVYDGQLGPIEDPSDWLAFEGRTDANLTVSTWGQSPMCPEVRDSQGVRVPAQCYQVPLNNLAVVRTDLPAQGIYYLVLDDVSHTAWQVNHSYNGTPRVTNDPLTSPLIFELLPGSPALPEAPDALGSGGRGDIDGPFTEAIEPPDPGCPAPGGPVDATSGTGDPAFPGMAWAALKTGFRAAVMWESSGPAVSSLLWTIGGGTYNLTYEPTPRRTHTFVLDRLPRGGTLCFQAVLETSEGAVAGAWQKVSLANAMHDRDETAEVYTINLLAHADQRIPDMRTVSSGIDGFAQRLWDATDGHVRLGRVLLPVGEITYVDTGPFTCSVPVDLAALVLPPANHTRGGTCNPVHDIVFTYDNLPHAAGSTYKDGIADPADAIWMNNLYEWEHAGVEADDVGAVLTHELGHYAFGMDDLYASVDGVGTGCWHPDLSISIMGSNRGATEFDGPNAPCRDKPPGYRSSWPRLQERFPAVPDRPAGPLPGPGGDGGAYELHATAPRMQDDAGSGRDAPEGPAGHLTIEPGVIYDGRVEGFFLGDQDDWYTFKARAGQHLEARLVGAGYGCFQLTRDDGATLAGGRLGDGCQAGQARRVTLTTTAPYNGTYHLAYGTLQPDLYRFSVGVGAPAPGIDGPLLGHLPSAGEALSSPTRLSP